MTSLIQLLFLILERKDYQNIKVISLNIEKLEINNVSNYF